MKMSGCMCGHTQQKEEEEEASQQEYDVLDACAVGEEKMMPQQHCAGRKYRGISLKRSAKTCYEGTPNNLKFSFIFEIRYLFQSRLTAIYWIMKRDDTTELLPWRRTHLIAITRGD